MNREMTQKKVLVLLPAFNEEITIEKTIENIKKMLPTAEILVVDNSSTDKTSEIALTTGAKVIKEPRQGKGFAVQKGFDYMIAKNLDCCFLVDADDTYGLDPVEKAIKSVLYDGIDMVIGTRETKNTFVGDLSKRQSHFRPGHRLGNQLFIFLHRSLIGGKIDDVLSGWRVLSRKFVASFPGGSKGFEIESQLNSHATAINASILNVKVDYKGRPEGSLSKLNTYSDGYRILRSTLRSFKDNRPFLAFSLLSAPWIVVTIWLVYLPFKTYFETGIVPNLPRLVTGVGTFLIAALLWATGMIIERVRDVRITLLLQRYHSNA
jgi:glycosyltransferase involved in cell wall biosynthesis